MTTTGRTIKFFREMGFVVERVEQRIPHSFITRDFIGAADLIAFQPDIGILALQVTSGSNHAARRDKVLSEPRVLSWLRSGGRFEIVSWRKAGERGKRKKWSCRREEIQLSHLRSEHAEVTA